MNQRPPRPKRGALTGLRYSPKTDVVNIGAEQTEVNARDARELPVTSFQFPVPSVRLPFTRSLDLSIPCSLSPAALGRFYSGFRGCGVCPFCPARDCRKAMTCRMARARWLTRLLTLWPSSPNVRACPSGMNIGS